MTVTARKYNPGFLTDEELMASFCVRTREFESMVEMLRECTGSSNPHQIVIGPRGSGKTSLLLRVAAEVRQDPELSLGFFPVVFAEESYEVDTAGEFWLEALSRLADEVPSQEDAPDLRAHPGGSAHHPGRPDARRPLPRHPPGLLRPGGQAGRADGREPEHDVPRHVRPRRRLAPAQSPSDRAAHHPARKRHQPLRRDRPPGPRPLRPVQGTHATPSRPPKNARCCGEQWQARTPRPRQSAHWRYSPAAARGWSPSWPGSARLAPFASS